MQGLASSSEKAQNITYYIGQVTNMVCSNDEVTVYSSTTINNRDPELLAAYKKALESKGNDELKDIVIELHDLLNLLGQVDPKKSEQSKSILKKISEKVGEAKKLGDNVKAILVYLAPLYKLIQPLAASHGISLPPLP